MAPEVHLLLLLGLFYGNRSIKQVDVVIDVTTSCTSIGGHLRVVFIRRWDWPHHTFILGFGEL